MASTWCFAINAAGIDERMNHVASDIAGAAGDQDRHA
jgi:hypothetical protein